MSDTLSNKKMARLVRNALYKRKIHNWKKVYPNGSIYISFRKQRLLNCMIRISDHPMRQGHPMETKEIFQLGSHKYIDGTWEECCEWIIEKLK